MNIYNIYIINIYRYTILRYSIFILIFILHI